MNREVGTADIAQGILLSVVCDCIKKYLKVTKVGIGDSKVPFSTAPKSTRSSQNVPTTDMSTRQRRVHSGSTFVPQSAFQVDSQSFGQA